MPTSYGERAATTSRSTAARAPTWWTPAPEPTGDAETVRNCESTGRRPGRGPFSRGREAR